MTLWEAQQRSCVILRDFECRCSRNLRTCLICVSLVPSNPISHVPSLPIKFQQTNRCISHALPAQVPRKDLLLPSGKSGAPWLDYLVLVLYRYSAMAFHGRSAITFGLGRLFSSEFGRTFWYVMPALGILQWLDKHLHSRWPPTGFYV